MRSSGRLAHQGGGELGPPAAEPVFAPFPTAALPTSAAEARARRATTNEDGWRVCVPRLLPAVLSSASHLATFVASTMQARMGAPSRARVPESTFVFPCPLPHAWDPGTPPSSNRSRARWVKRRDQKLWTNLIIAVCSWAALGRAHGCPRSMLPGRPLSLAQQGAVARVEGLVAEMTRANLDVGCGSKLDTVIAELARASSAPFDDDAAVVSSPEVGARLPLVSDRIKFDVSDEKFDPLPVLGPFVAAAFFWSRKYLSTDERLPKHLSRSSRRSVRLFALPDAGTRRTAFASTLPQLSADAAVLPSNRCLRTRLTTGLSSIGAHTMRLRVTWLVPRFAWRLAGGSPTWSSSRGKECSCSRRT